MLPNKIWKGNDEYFLLTQFQFFIWFALHPFKIVYSYSIVVILFCSFVLNIPLRVVCFVSFSSFFYYFGYFSIHFDCLWSWIIHSNSFNGGFILPKKYVFDLFIPIVYYILHTITKFIWSKQRCLSFKITMQLIRMPRYDYKILIRKFSQQTICIQFSYYSFYVKISNSLFYVYNFKKKYKPHEVVNALFCT